jgi:hypothetical protein
MNPCLVFGLVLVAACSRAASAPNPAAPPVPVAKPIGLLAEPHVTLIALTDWQAVLKPCGCTVELQKGGIERIARAVNELRRFDDSLLVVHAGPLLAEDEAPPAQKQAQHARRIQAFQQAAARLPVQAAALAGHDLRLGGAAAAAALGQWPPDLLAIDAQPAIPRAKPTALRGKGAQVVVVLANLGLRESRRLVRAVPGIDVVVVGALDRRTEALADAEREGDTLLVHATRQGSQFAAVTLVPRAVAPGQPTAWIDASQHLPGAVTELHARLQVFDRQLQQWRTHDSVATKMALPVLDSERQELAKRLDAARAATGQTLPGGNLAAFRSVGLPWSAPVDAQVQRIVAAYDAEVARLNEKALSQPPPLPPNTAGYIGAQACLACHVAVKPFWAQNLHAKAWEPLVKAGKTKDLDCVPCHVTGFLQPGGSALGKLDGLTGAGCESCHGPGSLHAAAPKKGAGSQIVRSPAADACALCHTPEHSPRFAFDAFRPRLMVPGHGLPPAP